MGRFAFGKRRSAAESENDVAAPSFRVLERTEVTEPGVAFNGGARLSAKTHTRPQTSLSDITMEENMFADLKPNTYRGSSNTTKTNSTDNSSRHSNASTAPSSTDLSGHDELKLANKRVQTEISTPPAQKPNPSGFLKGPGGRSWSFGAQKKQLPSVPSGDEPSTPPVPEKYKNKDGRARATTTSTDATVTPPRVDEDFNLDLGGSFSKMLLGFDKRSSVVSVQNESGRPTIPPPSMQGGGRLSQPSPLIIDKMAKVEAPPHMWNSNRSNENLMAMASPLTSPTVEMAPPPVPKHGAPFARPQVANHSSSENIMKRTSAFFGRRKSQGPALEESEPVEDEDAKLLKDSLQAVNKFMASPPIGSTNHDQSSNGRYKRNDAAPSSSYRAVSSEMIASKDEEDNLFDTVPLNAPRFTPKPAPHIPLAQGQHKVMTPSEFEQYRKDKEIRDRRDEMDKMEKTDHDEDEDDINYEDDEDEAERSKQLVKQRKKQEAHMTVYRQQMMKVTGESGPARPPIHPSYSTPFLTPPDASKNPSEDGADSDEEIPLGLLAAHGFPNKNRPPNRLTNMMSNPNLRQATQPSYQRPGSATGGAAPGPGGSLPVFARNLPTDPYGLVNASVRENFALGGGMPAGTNNQMQPGGLVGVIASEERSRAMRRGSPQVPQMDGGQPGMGGFDPVNGIPPQMMYPQQTGMPNMMLTPGDQAQLHMSQQMSQFMQMQMQFMQMMAAGNNQANGPPRSAGHMAGNSFSSIPPMNGMGMPMGMDMMGGGVRDSFAEKQQGSMLEPSRPDIHGRTMSMVQPSSASWLQAPGAYAPGNGYAPSIAPSERSNIGLPGRYRPVSTSPAAAPDHIRSKSSMSGALGVFDDGQTLRAVSKSPSTKLVNTLDNAEEDDEEGWAAMKAKRDQKKSLWRTKKTIGASGIGALIS